MTQKPLISFEEAFNQAINSLDTKGTLVLINALVQKALYAYEEESKHKSKVQKILTPTLIT